VITAVPLGRVIMEKGKNRNKEGLVRFAEHFNLTRSK
jgi:hypothetical protein